MLKCIICHRSRWCLTFCRNWRFYETKSFEKPNISCIKYRTTLCLYFILFLICEFTACAADARKTPHNKTSKYNLHLFSLIKSLMLCRRPFPVDVHCPGGQIFNGCGTFVFPNDIAYQRLFPTLLQASCCLLLETEIHYGVKVFSCNWNSTLKDLNTATACSLCTCVYDCTKEEFHVFHSRSSGGTPEKASCDL